MNPFLKLVLELGPLVVFFIMNSRADLFVATQWFMGAIAISLILNWVLERRIPTMPLVSGAFVLVFGALTLWLQDELFIKMKPTIVNTLFAIVVLGSHYIFHKPIMKLVMQDVVPLKDAGWRILNFRWGWFFVVLAVLNEIAWRGFSTDTWVAFKTFGVMPLTLAFGVAQVPLFNRYALDDDEDGDDNEEETAPKGTDRATT